MPNPRSASSAIGALALVLALAGCGASGRGGNGDDGAVVATAASPVLETVRRQQTLEDCPEQLAPCATITLEYVEVSEAPDALRASIRAFLDSTVFAPIDEHEAGSRVESATAETLMRQFLDGYRDFMERFPEAPGTWSIERVARPLWNEAGVVSLEFSEESYTGGAHPHAEVKLVSFAAADGRHLRLDDLFIDGHEEPLRALGEKAFRVAHGLGAADDLVAAGFWFEDGRFRLGDNFAVTAAGLRIHFNAYEVAPYAMGPTDLTLARAELARWARPGGPLAPGA